jgi:hypothetical protein
MVMGLPFLSDSRVEPVRLRIGVERHDAGAALGRGTALNRASEDVRRDLEEPVLKAHLSPKGTQTSKDPKEALLGEILALFRCDATPVKEDQQRPVVEPKELTEALLDVDLRLKHLDQTFGSLVPVRELRQGLLHSLVAS